MRVDFLVPATASIPPDVDVHHVLQEALALPLPERSYVVERLLVSLDEEVVLSPVWQKELDARVRRSQTGETRSYSREEVRQQIQAMLK